MIERFVVRPDSNGFCVYDMEAGAPATIGGAPQTGLSQADAAHTTDLLNRRESERPGPYQTH
jgi:hypothetical protein